MRSAHRKVKQKPASRNSPTLAKAAPRKAKAARLGTARLSPNKSCKFQLPAIFSAKSPINGSLNFSCWNALYIMKIHNTKTNKPTSG